MYEILKSNRRTITNGTSRGLATLAYALALSLITVAVPALATLDQNESSVNNDMTHFKAAKHRKLPYGSNNRTTQVHELTIDENTIRQYADGDGHIYAVTWKGISQPDLSVLLGDHFTEYLIQAEVGALARGGRGPRRIQTNGVVVETSGHMRALRGIAYIPSKLPAGINAGDLQ